MSKQENNVILRAGGASTNKGRSPTMTIAFTADMMTEIKRQAEEKCITKGEVVRQLIMKGLQKDDDKTLE
jgi:hypothetical protein